jgi:hypothetical protein
MADQDHCRGTIWAVVPPSCAMTTRYLETEDGVHVAKVGHMDYSAGSVFADVANAKRLAACWNAFVGIPTEKVAALRSSLRRYDDALVAAGVTPSGEDYRALLSLIEGGDYAPPRRAAGS